MHKRFLIIGFALVLLVGSLLACGESSTNTGTATNTSSPSGSTPTSAPAQQHFKVGQTVKVGDMWQITVDSAKTSTGSEFNKPQQSGDVFLVIVVTMKNLSSQEQDVSSLAQWTLQDATGQKYDGTLDTDAGASLDGKVEAGSLLKGSLAYEVPKTMKSYTLAFEADLASAGETIWDISV